ncbi:trans-resveratrol di-O-methyltransferase-like [Benincasa hispida]|uniref:trans-resveratrol di-O-methyltransferase-like n=1 Tax=Benincasa hispida TaxID=102211 RepID=UPI0018FF6FD1|nr:trans-resveratrol di-O-methyltransferase-like [Benincasa hispida]
MEGTNTKMGMEEEEVLKAQAHIWNHIFSFINSMALKCAIELRIPDAISRHGSPITLSQLLSSLQIHPRKSQHVRRIMRILAHSGFFLIQNKTTQQGDDDQDQEEAYSLTNASILLLQHNPLTLSPYLLFVLNHSILHPWQSLSVWFRSNGLDRSPFETAYGKKFWEYMESETRDGEAFNESMARDSKLVMSVLLGNYKSMFEGVESFVDVGGGTGTLAKAMAEAFPQMKCFVFDLPQVVAGLEGNHNLMFLQGDMFQAIPPADALLLKWILHNWNDEECVKILKKCKEAITSNKLKKGKVIIIDMVVTNNNNNNKKADYYSIQTQLFWDMVMMAAVGGMERDEQEWAQLFHKAGFASYNIFPILGLRSLIELYP